MRVIFVTANTNKLEEAKRYLEPLGFEIEQMMIGGEAPEFIEPQSDDLEQNLNVLLDEHAPQLATKVSEAMGNAVVKSLVGASIKSLPFIGNTTILQNLFTIDCCKVHNGIYTGRRIKIR